MELTVTLIGSVQGRVRIKALLLVLGSGPPDGRVGPATRPVHATSCSSIHTTQLTGRSAPY